MAILFDSSTDVISLAANSVLEFPDNPWAISVFVKLTSNAGTVNHSVTNYTGGTGFVSFRIVMSSGSPADDLWGEVNDGTDDIYFESNNTNPFASNTNWTHLLLQRTGTGSTCTMEMYVNGTYQAVNPGTGGYTNNALDAITGGTIYIGNNSANSRPLAGHMAEWAKWDRVFTTAEIASLSNGYAPINFKNSLKAYLPLVRSTNEQMNNLSVTATGVTVSDHPRIIYPAYTIIGFPPPASTTHNMIGTAAVTFAGSAVARREYRLIGNAAVTFAGSAAARREYHLVGSAAVTFAGTSVARREYHMVGSAAVTFAGTSVLHRQYNMVGSASVTFAGSATMGKQHNLVGSATVTFAGGGLVARLQTLAGSASVTFGGTALALVPTGFVKVTPNTDTDFSQVNPNTDSDFIKVTPNP